MDISLELLLESLNTAAWMESSHPQKYIPYDQASIRDVALIPTSRLALDKGILWCGLLSEILSLDCALREGCSFLSIGSEEEFVAISTAGDCNCLFFPQHPESKNILPEVFNEAARAIRMLNDWDHKLDLAIANGRKIQDLIDINETVMKNPFVVWNPSFDILAYSKNIPIPRPSMQKILQDGHFSGADIERITRMGYLKDSDLYGKISIFYPPNWMDCPFALRVYFEGQNTVISIVQYFLHSQPTPAQIELLTRFEAKFNAYVTCSLQTGIRRKSFLYEHILIDLIEGRLTHEDDIIDRLKVIKVTFQGKYRMYQIKFEKYTSSLDNYTRSRVKSIFPAGKIIHYRDRLLVLNQEDDAHVKPASEEYIRTNLEKMLEVCSAFVGISDTISDLTHIRASYLQTEAALRIGGILGDHKRIWSYSETFFLDMVNFYSAQSGIGTGQVYFSPLDDLILKDQSSGNNNLQLLDVYLNCDRNITCTANHLNLHRNSVIYRVERIEQILGGSLNDPELRFKLLVSLKAIQFLDLMKAVQNPS